MTMVGLIWAQKRHLGVIGAAAASPGACPRTDAFQEITMGHTIVMGRRTSVAPAKVRPLAGEMSY